MVSFHWDETDITGFSLVQFMVIFTKNFLPPLINSTSIIFIMLSVNFMVNLGIVAANAGKFLIINSSKVAEIACTWAVVNSLSTVAFPFILRSSIAFHIAFEIVSSGSHQVVFITLLMRGVVGVLTRVLSSIAVDGFTGSRLKTADWAFAYVELRINSHPANTAALMPPVLIFPSLYFILLIYIINII